MTWRKAGYWVASIPFALWAAASILFFVSRLLPGIGSPQGLSDTDTVAYGSSGMATVAKARENYKRKLGLHLPIFYFSLLSTAEKKALSFGALPVDQAWVVQAYSTYDPENLQTFYTAWQKFTTENSSKAVTALRKTLTAWAISNEIENRKFHARQFSAVLEKGAYKQAKELEKAWQALHFASPSLTYLLPALQWHGTQNQYHAWLSKLLRGNLGNSNRDYRPVTDKISEALKVTGAMGLIGLFLSILFSFTFGLLLAHFKKETASQIGRYLLYVLDSIPAFMLALLLWGLFLYAGGTLPTPYLIPGQSSVSDFFAYKSLWLASFCIALLLTPYLSLQFYQSLVAEINQPYLRTSRAKGLSQLKSLLLHALPTAAIPLVTVVSEVLVGLIGGILVVEVTFSLPGVGTLLTQSVLTKDYPVVVGITLFLLAYRIVIVTLSDIINTWIDPRMNSRK